MRSKLFDELNIGMLGLEERGFVFTVWARGDELFMPFEDIDEILGSGWLPIAERIAQKGIVKISLNTEISGWVRIKLNLPRKTVQNYIRSKRRKMKGKV